MLRPATLKLVCMRLLALGFLGLGLLQWSELLGAVHLGAPDFFTLTLQVQALVLFFAVANLVAAVGLWLTATWGVVVWFAAAGTRIALHTVAANTFGWTPVATAAEGVGIVVFVLLVVFEARAERREIQRQREYRRNRARE
jgi:uncharacterized membrane protein (DUF2068 family)